MGGGSLRHSCMRAREYVVLGTRSRAVQLLLHKQPGMGVCGDGDGGDGSGGCVSGIVGGSGAVRPMLL